MSAEFQPFQNILVPSVRNLVKLRPFVNTHVGQYLRYRASLLISEQPNEPFGEVVTEGKMHEAEAQPEYSQLITHSITSVFTSTKT